MSRKADRPILDLQDSTLRHHSAQLFVDSVTGMVLSRVGSFAVNGYERVAVNGYELYAHRVVWEAINGPIPKSLTINHRDGNPKNNHPANLELATMSEQHRHAYAIGLRSGNGPLGVKRTRHSRLSSAQVEKLVAAEKGTLAALARECGISLSYAYHVHEGLVVANPRLETS